MGLRKDQVKAHMNIFDDMSIAEDTDTTLVYTGPSRTHYVSYGFKNGKLSSSIMIIGWKRTWEKLDEFIIEHYVVEKIAPGFIYGYSPDGLTDLVISVKFVNSSVRCAFNYLPIKDSRAGNPFEENGWIPDIEAKESIRDMLTLF